LVAVAGTWAVIWWSESMLGLVAATPLNLTALTSVKPEPAIVTLVPAGPVPGPKAVIRGSTRKVPALWPLPEGVTTVSLPVEPALRSREDAEAGLRAVHLHRADTAEACPVDDHGAAGSGAAGGEARDRRHGQEAGRARGGAAGGGDGDPAAGRGGWHLDGDL